MWPAQTVVAPYGRYVMMNATSGFDVQPCHMQPGNPPMWNVHADYMHGFPASVEIPASMAPPTYPPYTVVQDEGLRTSFNSSGPQMSSGSLSDQRSYADVIRSPQALQQSDNIDIQSVATERCDDSPQRYDTFAGTFHQGKSSLVHFVF